jgi:hypothetical protein
MAQQGEQLRVGARKGFAYYPVKSAYWLAEIGKRLIPICFLVEEPFTHFKYCLGTTMNNTFFHTFDVRHIHYLRQF